MLASVGLRSFGERPLEQRRTSGGNADLDPQHAARPTMRAWNRRSGNRKRTLGGELRTSFDGAQLHRVAFN